MSENKNYYQELYTACNYVIDHIEVFKDYAIYNFVTYEKSLEKDQMRQGEGVVLKLHNRLLAQFKFLIGEVENKPNQTDPKGTDVVPKINYRFLDQETLATMLVITDNFVNNDKSGKKMNQQIFRINIDKKADLMDFLVEKILPDKIAELDQFRTEIVINSLKPKEKE